MPTPNELNIAKQNASNQQAAIASLHSVYAIKKILSYVLCGRVSQHVTLTTQIGHSFTDVYADVT